MQVRESDAAKSLGSARIAIAFGSDAGRLAVDHEQGQRLGRRAGGKADVGHGAFATIVVGNEAGADERRCTGYVGCCILHIACCVLRVACCGYWHGKVLSLAGCKLKGCHQSIMSLSRRAESRRAGLIDTINMMLAVLMPGSFTTATGEGRKPPIRPSRRVGTRSRSCQRRQLQPKPADRKQTVAVHKEDTHKHNTGKWFDVTPRSSSDRCL
jgi:hypothetical protein